MHRGWMDSAIFKNDKYSRRDAWCWLIENANFKDRKDFIAGKPVLIRRGSVIYTERQLAKIWKWGRQQVRTFLKHLKVDKKITINITHGITQISITNYTTYQETKPKKQPKTNPRLTQEQPSLEECKEGKEGKECKEDNSPTKRGTRIDGKFKDGDTIPNDYLDAATKKGLGKERACIEFQKFVNYWTAASGKNATKLNWIATWRSWVLNSIEWSGNNNGYSNGSSGGGGTSIMDITAKIIAERDCEDA